MVTLTHKGRDMNLNDRFEVLEEELPGDEYDNEVNHWYVYDNETETVVNNEWFDTEKRAQDYLEWYLIVGAPC